MVYQVLKFEPFGKDSIFCLVLKKCEQSFALFRFHNLFTASKTFGFPNNCHAFYKNVRSFFRCTFLFIILSLSFTFFVLSSASPLKILSNLFWSPYISRKMHRWDGAANSRSNWDSQQSDRVCMNWKMANGNTVWWLGEAMEVKLQWSAQAALLSASTLFVKTLN